MIEIIRSSAEQREELQRSWARLRGIFKYSGGNQSVEQLDGYQGDEEFQDYGLNLYIGENSAGIDLRGPSFADPNKNIILLHFVTFNSRGGRHNALLARHNDRVGLYHNGRVNPRASWGAASNDRPVAIDGQPYYHVADLDDDNLFLEVVAFHLSRYSPDLGRSNKKFDAVRSGFDPGARKGGIRSQAIFNARHHPITQILKRKLEPRFSIVPCPVVSPDLLVQEQGGQRILFEIKPNSGAHDLMLACAQLLIYNYHAEAHKMVVVSRPIGSSALASTLKKFMAASGISYLEYKVENKKIMFPSLGEIIT